MALTFTVEEKREGRNIGFQGDKDSITIDWSAEYMVTVTDPGNGSFNPATVSPYAVATATGLPVVNRSIYSVGGKIIPFVICRNKQAKQHAKRLDRWDVTTKYKAVLKSGREESDNQPIDPPAALTDIVPQVVPELGETERVLYIDKSDAPKAVLTPLKRFFSQPLMEPLPTLTLKISQYEPSITYEQMLSRKFKVNSGTYRGQARYKWLIEEVEAVEVDVTLSGGTVSAALVTYTVTQNPFSFGWKESRALIDTHYDDGTGKILPFQDGELRTQNYGFIDINGEKKAGTVPDTIEFEQYDDIDFDSFLQV